MKRVLILCILFCCNLLYAQNTPNQISELVNYLKTQQLDEAQIKSIVEEVVKDPSLYNKLWKNVVEHSVKGDSSKWNLLRDMNVQFKSFQTSAGTPGFLGLSYDLNYSYSNFKEEESLRSAASYGISTNGNIAFNQNYNPTDFLESKIHYSFTKFYGGVLKSKDDTSVFTRLNMLEDKLVLLEDMHGKDAEKLWKEFSKSLRLSNQYYAGLSPKFAMENDQRFFKKQFAGGISLDLGAKAWNTKSALSYLNILDYPFALLRALTGTDDHLTIYGSTLPTVQCGMDYIIPLNDTARRTLLGNINPYPRFKFETGFRTLVSRVKDESIFFNADFRYYTELNAPSAIKNANLSNYTYLVLALQSSSGFYVSYADGKLPFDAKKDQVYAIGFNYKF